ncbi:MAG: Adenosine deaminase [uncultured Propionibacteriaceae bacterium]|uniref:Adenosine deaminase n=1 Tax=uncultured Propionibacteriaceae bacterium TaxID=257457 RepID=A0A6J4NZA1_9ACTN|nr:MAG: Adenosine deaminase [uncultured Propionibacteriaceae bacterium]
MSLDLELLRAAPKVSLHDHLDGGLRPQTIIDLARGINLELPADTADDLAEWFFVSANSGSLEMYLKTFDYTVAVMQTAANLRRVAREFVEDLAADGVVYGETRWAPEQHLEQGLTTAEAVEAVRDGLAEGMEICAEQGHPIVVQQLVTSMRHASPSRDIAKLAIKYRDDSVAGFDIAGAEAGYPPTRYLDAFDYLKRNNAYFTIHAGEAFGLPSIWEALQICGANRLGHGVRIMDDISTGDDGRPMLGELASYVRNQRVPLEMCPSSNVQTGAAPSIAEHPIGTLAKLRFRVTVNTDNRLVSRTTLTREFTLLSEAFGYDLSDVRWFTINAAKSAFYRFDHRLALIEDVIKPGFAELGAG